MGPDEGWGQGWGEGGRVRGGRKEVMEPGEGGIPKGGKMV